MGNRSERSGASLKDITPDDEEKRQNSRACDFCHRMKMKCIGKEEPPCNRCSQAGHDCTFDGPRKSKASKVEDRLKIVENQMIEVQASLASILALKRPSEGMSAPAPRTGGALMEIRERWAREYDGGRISAAPASHLPPAHLHSSYSHYSGSNHPSASSILNGSRGSNSHTTSSRVPSPLPHQPGPLNFVPFTMSSQESTNLRSMGWDCGRERERDRRSSPVLEADYGAQSEDEDYPHAVIYNNMLSLAEAARLKADGQLEEKDYEEEDEQPWNDRDRRRPLKREADAAPLDNGTDEKRQRRTSGPIPRHALPMQRGNLVHQYQNPIELGFCSPQKGEQLYHLFMDSAAIYVPILDSEVDTWNNLCKTAPFTVTVISFVGSKIEDAGGPASDLQNKCKAHAENIGMHTLFTPVARIDVLQAMIILSSWGDTSWRPGGHALRIAMDMGLYRCLPYLAASGMGAGKSYTELQEERQLVVGARCWLAVYKSEFEMAFNLGRPALFAVEDTLSHCRKFLEHPLALRTDSRLVATCELLSLRLSVHQLYSVWPSATRIPNLDEQIEKGNASYARWLRYWEDYYRRLNIPRSNFLYETLYSQHAHAVLHTNSRILHSVRSRRHVSQLSDKRKTMLVQALQSAKTLVSMAVRGASYAAHFAKANYYTHVGVAFAARMVIRLTSLIPEHGDDLRQTGRDLEAITETLAQVPGYQFAQHIRDIVVKARRAHVLPPSSKAASPTLGSRSLDPLRERKWEKSGDEEAARRVYQEERDLEQQKKEQDREPERAPERERERQRQREHDYQQQRDREREREREHTERYLRTSTSPNAPTTSSLRFTSMSPEKSGPGTAKDTLLPRPSPQALPHDFIYAEKLFAGGPSLDLQVFDAPEIDLEPIFNLDTWFPYPPLESDGSFALSESPLSWGAGTESSSGGYWQ